MRDEENRKGQGLTALLSLFERGILMSATKRQQAINEWAAAMVAGYDYKTATITESRLETLQTEAGKANLNLNSASEQMFRVSADHLNNTQATELHIMLCEAVAKTIKPRHVHYCVECGDSMVCFEPPGCTETEDECRSCHEGFGRGEWNAYERRLAQKGLL